MLDLSFIKNLLEFHNFLKDQVVPYIAETLNLELDFDYHLKFDYSDIEMGYLILGIYHKAHYLPKDILLYCDDFNYENWKERILKTIKSDNEDGDGLLNELF